MLVFVTFRFFPLLMLTLEGPRYGACNDSAKRSSVMWFEAPVSRYHEGIGRSLEETIRDLYADSVG